MYELGMFAVRIEGAPLDPLDAAMYRGPGATDEWFEKQVHAFFDLRRERGDSEDELMKHQYYLPHKEK